MNSDRQTCKQNLGLALIGNSCVAAIFGRKAQARDSIESILANRSAFVLLSEDVHPDTEELWGNLPQAYSIAGIIKTATRLSSSREDAWPRASS
jgi:GH15 family glucan-1,4-alpha-glucosidase